MKSKPKNPRAPRAFLPTMTSTPPTPPLPSMDDLEEPEQLTGFMQNATQADVVTDVNDFDEVPIRMTEQRNSIKVQEQIFLNLTFQSCKTVISHWIGYII